MNRLPPDAYQYFASLDPKRRSYETVANHFGVSKRTVCTRAGREQWRARIAKIEAQARDQFDEKQAESLQAINARHVKTARFILAKGIEALRSMPLLSAMSAVRAIEIAIKVERLVVTDPGSNASEDAAAKRRTKAHELAEEMRLAIAGWHALVPSAPPDDAPEAHDADA